MGSQTIYYVDAIAKMDKIFRYLETNDAIEFMSIVNDLGISKSSAHRLVSFLVELGYLERDENNRIRLGIRLFKLGYKMGENITLIKAARPHLEKLSKETGFVVHLCMTNQDGEGVFLDRIDSRAYTFTDTAIGGKVAFHCSAAGKCLAAWAEPEHYKRIVSSLDFKAYTKNTITSMQEFNQEMEKVRRLGYSTDLSEHENFIKAIGMPIFDWSGKLVGAISLGAFNSEFDAMDFDHMLNCVQSAVKDIENVIGIQK